MIAGPEVPDDVFNAIRKHYNEREIDAGLRRRDAARPRGAGRRVQRRQTDLSEQEILELTVLVGTYLMHNRVFTALKVDVEPKKN